jgi:amino acid adenylation domain-containing protein/thioester reductase-like protein
MIITKDKILELLAAAKSAGVRVHLNDGILRLKVDKNQPISPSLLNELKENKERIINFLEQEQEQLDEIRKVPQRIPRYNRSTLDKIPLSFAQEELWLLDKLQGSLNYHLSNLFRISGPLDADLLDDTLRMIIDRHEILRTILVQDDDSSLHQLVLDSNAWKLKRTNELNTDLNQSLQYDLKTPFRLESDFLIRAHLIKENDEVYLLHIVMHHLVFDGWSIPIFFKELAQIYDELSEGNLPTLKELDFQYSDYAIWQRESLKSENIENMMEYWVKQLRDYKAFDLVTDFPRPSVRSIHGKSINMLLDQQLTSKLNALASDEGITLYMLILAAFKILMYKYTGEKDICLGTTMANREKQGTGDLIGLFVNVLPLRTKIDEEESLTSLFQKVKDTLHGAFQNKEMPFEKIVAKVEKQRDLSRNPIFQMMVVYQGKQGDTAERMKINDLEIYNESPNSDNAKYDIAFNVSETNDGKMILDIGYPTDLFKEETIVGILNHYRELLKSITKNKHQRIKELSLVSDEESQKLEVDLNDTFIYYPDQKTITSLFEEQVESNPEKTAVQFGELSLSYKELNEKSNVLAHHLLENHQIQQGVTVGIVLDRSLDMITAIVGVLKSGAAYVPIDYNLPTERKQFIVEDTNINIIITSSSKTLDFINKKAVAVIDIDAKIEEENKCNPAVTLYSKDPAYIMYTSGSTGMPKGSLVTHKNVVKLFYGQEEMAIQESDRVLQWSNFSFDGSVYEIFGALLKGASLHMLPEGASSDAGKLNKIINTEQVTFAFFTTALFNAFVDYGIENLRNMRKILFGGEVASVQHAKRALDILGHNKVIHVYGTTEATVFSTYFSIDKAEGCYLPIGKPLSNTSIYIVNPQEQLVGMGMTGEICIGGEGVSNGYLNRVELNQEKFVELSFGGLDHSVYKTGDMARWNKEGNIEIIGRVDDLVKIRGYRIELGEIENVLGKASFVRQCCLVCNVNGQGEKYIIAYVVPEQKFNRESLKKFLSDRLPQYMVPSFFIEMKVLPLTANGKVNRKALPLPEASKHTSDEFVVPSNDTQEKLVKIWQELIEIDKVGVHDDFFEIGGHSLIATKMIKMVKDIFDLEITVADIFNFSTVSELAEIIQAHSTKESDLEQPIDLVKESEVNIDYTGLASLQKYNQNPEHILLTGATGFVGVYVLHNLIQTTTAQIHCLIRSKDNITGLERIRDKMVFFQLDDKNLEERVKIVYGDLAKEKMGISYILYKELLHKIDYIFHIGTHMDHHSSYHKLKKTNVDGNAELIKFAIKEKHKKIVYASTQPQNEGNSSSKVIDETNSRSEETHLYGSGYSGSKWVGEKVMLDSINHGVDTVIFRLGLVTGDNKTARIPTEQWFPRLLKTCYNIGSYFDEFHLPAIPVDFLSQSLVKLALTEGNLRVFHLTSKQLVSLGEFFKNPTNTLKNLEKVTVSEWLTKLNNVDTEDLPIASFIDFSSDQIKQTMAGNRQAANSIPSFVDNPVSTKITLDYLDKYIGITYPDTKPYFSMYLQAAIDSY